MYVSQSEPVVACSLGQEVSVKKFPTLTFVDRYTFNNLQGRDFTLQDFSKVVANYGETHKSISVMTQNCMRFTNNEMYRILFGTRLGELEHTLPAVDMEYVREVFISRLISDVYFNNMQSPSQSGDLLFEILPVSDEEFVVVLEKGFLNYLTSTKAAPEEFVLACLRCMHRFKCDTSQLTGLFLKLRLIEGYHKLISLRIR